MEKVTLLCEFSLAARLFQRQLEAFKPITAIYEAGQFLILKVHDIANRFDKGIPQLLFVGTDGDLWIAGLRGHKLTRLEYNRLLTGLERKYSRARRKFSVLDGSMSAKVFPNNSSMYRRRRRKATHTIDYRAVRHKRHTPGVRETWRPSSVS
jgi:hypothetical protein